MKQKIQDFLLRLQSEKKMQFIVGAVVIGLALMFLFPSEQKRVKRPIATKEVKTAKLTDNESYNDLLTRLAPDIQKQENKINQIEDKLSGLDKKIDENSDRVAEIFKKLMEKMQQSQQQQGIAQSGTEVSAPPPIDVPDMGTSMGGGMQQISEMESFVNEQQDIAPPVKTGPEASAFIGAGDSVRVKLLAGVNAPTDGTPYPVVLKLCGDVYGPDGSALPLGEARLIAAAQGSITDSRALFRLTSLNLRLPDGRRIVKRVDGWVVGEDGIRGMQGVLIDPLGKAIGGAMMAGAVQGFGSALEMNNVSIQDGGIFGTETWNVTGNPWEFALGRSIKEGANEWSDIIKDRVKNMVPVVQVLSGREATAVFAKSVSIKGLYEVLTQGDESGE
ncbi:MAG: hypothetical protein GYA55_09165 [SAR324 cluster bacterium]|uniref:Conjugal transfer protein TraB n=1 Tax=SAR324 cluster bacterium TaxID=2024889 RepID=A0A7X9FSC0_9DELT|nr:hypothetical protein [SAR324 cluster bacterium]